MKINFEQLAATMDMTIDQYLEYLYFSQQSLRSELDKVRADLLAIGQVCTEKSRNIKVILDDPNFDLPISNLEKNYES